MDGEGRSESREEGEERRSSAREARLRVAVPVAFALLACGLALAIDASVPARGGEPALLRWVRVVADHPLRSALAFGLIALAFAPRRPGPA